MNFTCNRTACGWTGAGCSQLGCPMGFSTQQHYGGNPFQPFHMPQPQAGCICPPTSEQTCQSKTCPRKDHD
jgi:hypothetical protein